MRYSRVQHWIGAMRLVHVFPSITVISGSAILMIVAHRGMPALGVILRGVLVVAASQVAVGTLNDYIDREDDARTQPEKPLPSGQTAAPVAVRMVVVGALLCCGFALSFGPASLALVAVGLSSGLAYDLRLKRTPFSPICYVISFLSLLTWIWLIAGTLTWKILIVYPFGVFLLLAAHLANALPDAETDAALGQRGLVVLLGRKIALNLVLAITGSAAICAFVFCAIERSTPGLVLSVASGALVLLAGWTALASDLNRPELQSIFRLVAPAIALIAASCLLAFQAAI